MKKLILSGIQPSGVLTIGNYLGALRNWSEIQYEYECLYFIADLHSITVPQAPQLLRENTKNVILQYAACGIDFNTNIVFLQSRVHEHAELGWILNCFANMGELSRMTQFKDKSKHQEYTGDSVSVGLFDYPVLMAADILLYDSDLVPVGEDQRQHLEITRTLAQRFNRKFSAGIFNIPEAYTTESGTRIMSLQDPSKKMSKSDPNRNSYVTLLDSRDDVIKKFKKAVTDTGDEVLYDERKPGIKNLINIYSATTDKTISETEKEFDGFRYGDFKAAVGETVADLLAGIQERYRVFNHEEQLAYLGERLEIGAYSAHERASKKLRQVYDAIGFMNRLT